MLLEDQRRVDFYSQNYSINLNNHFTLTEETILGFKIAKFEFKVTAHHGLWTNGQL